MDLLFSTYTNFFGRNIENDKAIEIRKVIIDTFRKPFIKKDMKTHGPLWNQYIAPKGAIDITNLDIDKNIQGYVLVDGKGKNMYLFLSSLKNFLSYLENRNNGLFPAIYFVNKDFTFCLSVRNKADAEEILRALISANEKNLQRRGYMDTTKSGTFHCDDFNPKKCAFADSHL